MLAPIEKRAEIYLKRNDLLEFGGCYGGKAECAFNFMQNAKTKQFVTCGSRDSLQCDIVSQMCENFGYTCDIFVPLGKSTPTTEKLEIRQNTTLHRIDKGYTVVIKRRAIDFAEQNGKTYIPFGMEHFSAIETIARQTENIPAEVKRVVVPVGGGITMAGVLKGLHDNNRTDVEVLGVMTGGRPAKTILQAFQTGIAYKLIPYKSDVAPLAMYSMRTDYAIDGVKLDAIYEGKCYPYLQAGDLLWIVGYHEVH